MASISQMGIKEKESFLTAKSQVETQYYRQTQDPRFQEFESIKILNLIWTGLFEEDVPASHDWLNFENSLIEDDPVGYQDTMLRLATLISCGFGTNAFAWSKTTNLVPIKTVLAGFQILILASTTLISETDLIDDKGNEQPSLFFYTQQGAGRVSGRDILLVSRATQQVVGRFPDFNQRTSGVETNVERMQHIHPEQNWIVTNLDK